MRLFDAAAIELGAVAIEDIAMPIAGTASMSIAVSATPIAGWPRTGTAAMSLSVAGNLTNGNATVTKASGPGLGISGLGIGIR